MWRIASKKTNGGRDFSLEIDSYSQATGRVPAVSKLEQSDFVMLC